MNAKLKNVLSKIELGCLLAVVVMFVANIIITRVYNIDIELWNNMVFSLAAFTFSYGYIKIAWEYKHRKCMALFLMILSAATLFTAVYVLLFDSVIAFLSLVSLLNIYFIINLIFFKNKNALWSALGIDTLVILFLLT